MSLHTLDFIAVGLVVVVRVWWFSPCGWGCNIHVVRRVVLDMRWLRWSGRCRLLNLLLIMMRSFCFCWKMIDAVCWQLLLFFKWWLRSWVAFVSFLDCHRRCKRRLLNVNMSYGLPSVRIVRSPSAATHRSSDCLVDDITLLLVLQSWRFWLAWLQTSFDRWTLLVLIGWGAATRLMIGRIGEKSRRWWVINVFSFHLGWWLQ